MTSRLQGLSDCAHGNFLGSGENVEPDSIALDWGLRICISNKLPDEDEPGVQRQHESQGTRGKQCLSPDDIWPVILVRDNR